MIYHCNRILSKAIMEREFCKIEPLNVIDWIYWWLQAFDSYKISLIGHPSNRVSHLFSESQHSNYKTYGSYGLDVFIKLALLLPTYNLIYKLASASYTSNNLTYKLSP